MDCPPNMPLVLEYRKFNKVEIAPNCPRCASSNTKFCYYNNYSFSQPRYFCKSCRRYWTKGGSLRNVPVGGGCRKSRRSRAARQGSGPNYESPSGSPDVGPTNTCTEIDMAAVFANYVNPNSGRQEDSFSPCASSDQSSENVPESSLDIDVELMFEYQNQVDWMNGVNGQDFVYQNCDAFEMQGIVGDDPVLGDILGSDCTNLQNFGSQLQLQEFGLFAPEDQLRISDDNLVTDNWSSFDLSASEIY